MYFYTGFFQFYFSKHSGRKLQWQHSLAQLLLRAQFNVIACYVYIKILLILIL